MKNISAIDLNKDQKISLTLVRDRDDRMFWRVEGNEAGRFAEIFVSELKLYSKRPASFPVSPQ
jgi:hypothetical protein